MMKRNLAVGSVWVAALALLWLGQGALDRLQAQ